MHKQIVTICLIVITLVSGNFIAAQDNKQQSKILVFGDSLSAAYGMPMANGWVTLLQRRLLANELNYRVINASISGNTSGNGLARVKDDLELHQPDIMLLELGGNDGLRGFPPSRFKINMRKIIEAALERDIKVVLLGIKLPPSYGKRYIEAFESVYVELANDYQLPFVPFFMEKVGDNPRLMQRDGIHPNEKGQPQLLDNVWPTLESILK
jgi:acyl-CoA thioesterase I